MKTKKSPGFSLFEILIAISILLILVISSFLVIPAQITKAKDAKIKANLHDIYLALEDYYDSNGRFPDSLPDCNNPLVVDGHVYMPNIPCDPFDGSNYYYTDGHGELNGQIFRVYANLRNENDNIISLIGCGGGCGPDCEYNYGVSSTNTLLTRCSYVCSPGGACELFEDAARSECPKYYDRDPTCNNECSKKSEFKCKDASGKQKPE